MKIKLFLFTVLLSTVSWIFGQNTYSYKVDLVNIKDDKVAIELQVPKLGLEKVFFNFPKVIPGTYANKDYGRFISDFLAYDSKGVKLNIKKKDNTFIISDAFDLTKITYSVNDTWDDSGDNFVFQPGGSNIEANKNVVLNNHAFFGYIEGNKELIFDIEINRPATFFPSTYLSFETTETTDFFKVDGYNFLVDNPILYCAPDTLSYIEGTTEIFISVYSETGMYAAEKIKEYIQPITSALANFWGGALPVDRYCFLVYLDDSSEKKEDEKTKGLGGYGALEHNHCSFYYLPEIAYEKRFKQMIFDVSAHEFLHIITPLNLHSYEIGDFNFIEPNMSQHLWLYEGVTEYFSLLVQVENELMDEEGYMKEIRSKINRSEEFKSVSFTKMSKKILSNKYQKEYVNVYSKGAVLAFLLDLEIRHHTDKQLIDVIKELVDKYGDKTSFTDELLIDEIVSITSPELGLFFEKYVQGYQPLPYQNYFNRIGWVYEEMRNEEVAFFGNFGVVFEDSVFKISTPNPNSVIKFRHGDVLNKVDDIQVTEDNIDDVFEDYFRRNKNYDTLTVEIIRDGKTIYLSGKPLKGKLSSKNYIYTSTNMTQLQKERNNTFFNRYNN